MLRSRRSRVLAIAAVVVVVAAGFGIWWQFIRDDSPPPPDIDRASEGLEESDSTGSGVDGTWAVTRNDGSGDQDTSTYAGYRIQEELAGIGGNRAVGRTSEVTGGVTIAGNQVTEASFEVDMTTLESDQDRRDNALRTRGLQTDEFPTASFTLTEPIDLPEDATTTDEAATFSAVGELTLHGVTKPATIEMQARLEGDEAVLVGSAQVVLADYEIEKPTIPGRVLSVEDQGDLEFQIYLAKE